MIDTKRFIEIGRNACCLVLIVCALFILQGILTIFIGTWWVGCIVAVLNAVGFCVWIPHYRLYAAMLKAELEKRNAVLP